MLKVTKFPLIPGIASFLKRVAVNGTIQDKEVYKRRCSPLKNEVITLLDKLYSSNDSLSSRKLQNKIFEELGVKIPMTTIRKWRIQSGWVITTTR